MKRIYLLFFLSFLSLNLKAQTPEEWMENGNEMYRAGNYDTAVACYTEALSFDVASADLYYNLGNAYYRTGDFAHAILNYERALRLSPRMSDARENLEIANSKIPDRITVLPKIFIVNWYDTLVTRFSPATWRFIVLILFALACAAAVVIVLSHRVTLRKWTLAALIVLGLLLLLSVWLTIASTLRFNSHSEAIVMQSSVAVKSSPEIQSVDKLILHSGTKVSISESLAGWHKITLADGTSGWCQEENLERI